MNPGQIQNVTPMRGGGDSLPDPDELSGEFPGELSAHASERDRNKSRVLALAIASLVHVFLFVILAWIVITNFQDEEIEMVLEQH